MPKYLIALLLALLAGPAFAEEPQVFNAVTTGEIVVDAEGRVVSVKLDHKELGAKVMGAFEERIRGWLFEPVIVDGQAVPAKAYMLLDLLAKSVPGTEGMQLEVRQVNFSEPPGSRSEAADGSAPARASDSGLRMTPPLYPSEPLRRGAGGRVQLLVRVGADGQVTEVATHSAELRTVFSATERERKLYARAFMRAAERAAKNWSLPAFAGGTVVVPVKFFPDGDTGRRWAPILRVPHEQPVWMADDEDVVQLSEGGEAGSDRFRLLSAIN